MVAETIYSPGSFPGRSTGKRNSLTPQKAVHQMKQRTLASLNKLSDRDTFRLAAQDLDSVARSLTPDLYSPFLSCIFDTDSDQKSPVRKECARLIGAMAETHGDSLAPLAAKIATNLTRRLRDSDCGVRSICADSVRILASRVTRVPVSVIYKPLLDSMGEQDYNLQHGSATCLVSAIEGSPEPDRYYLQKVVLPRVVKLLGCGSFKAKAAGLAVVEEIISVGAVADSRSVVAAVVGVLSEFMSSKEWTARRAAAEAMGRIAAVGAVGEGRKTVSGFKGRCLEALESCRFDKIKHVRDAVNEALDAFKNVLDEADEIPYKENVSDKHLSTAPKVIDKAVVNSPFLRKKELSVSRSPPSSACITPPKKKNTPEKRSSPGLGKIDRKKISDWKIEIAVPRNQQFKVHSQDNYEEIKVEQESPHKDMDLERNSRRRFLTVNEEVKASKIGGLRSVAGVLPLHMNESSMSNVSVSNGVVSQDKINSETDLCLIRKQLLQIENQQTNLLDLLQMFIGNSQNGIRSLESRVHGIEMVLDEISHGMAMSSGRTPNADDVGNKCCLLPGSEFLSSKFWRKPEGRYSDVRYSTSGMIPSNGALGNKETAESWESKNRFRNLQGGLVINPLAEIRPSTGAAYQGNDSHKQTTNAIEGRSRT